MARRLNTAPSPNAPATSYALALHDWRYTGRQCGCIMCATTTRHRRVTEHSASRVACDAVPRARRAGRAVHVFILRNHRALSPARACPLSTRQSNTLAPSGGRELLPPRTTGGGLPGPGVAPVGRVCERRTVKGAGLSRWRCDARGVDSEAHVRGFGLIHLPGYCCVCGGRTSGAACVLHVTALRGLR